MKSAVAGVALATVSLVLTASIVIIGVTLVKSISTTRLQLEQCQQQVCRLEAERKYVKERIGVFYPKIEWEESE